MLLPKNTNPAFSTYYYGSVVLRVLMNDAQEPVDFLDLFEKVNSCKKISIRSFTLALDWLFIIGSIKLAENGKFVKCF